MGKARKKNKVQKLTDREYAEYIAFLKTERGVPSQTYPLLPTLIPPLPTGRGEEKSEELE